MSEAQRHDPALEQYMASMPARPAKPDHQSTFSQDPAAVNFNVSMATEAGRKAMFGDPERVHSLVANHVRAAHEAFVAGHATVSRLANDETRTHVVKHEAARTIGGRTIAAIEKAQQAINGAADQLQGEFADTINRAFALDLSRPFVYDRIEKWIGETAKAKDGIQRIRAEMEEDPDIVTTLHHSKPYIMGLAKEVRLSLLDAGVEMHQPDAMRKLEDANKLRALAAKYARVTKGIANSWWNNSLANKAASRVEI